MGQIKNASVAQLLAQLKFSPIKQRIKQLAGAEKLLAIIEKEKEYPFEFVCFHITGYRPKGAVETAIKGKELADDLRIVIAKLSGEVDIKTEEQGEKIFTIQEMAAHCGVSIRTIERWRKRGLVAKKFVFPDRRKLFGFSQSTADAFAEVNKELVEKAKRFSGLSESEKDEIIGIAKKMVKEGARLRYHVINEIARQTGRSKETIRYTLLNYEKDKSGRQIFTRPAGAINPAAATEIYRLYKQGVKISELAINFWRDRTSIYRVINARRAKAITAQKIEFIPSDEFLAEGAQEKILGQPLPAGDGAVLKRQAEQDLFRRLNFLKYLASVHRTKLNAARPSSVKLKMIENYLERAEAIKKILIESNLGLVVSIAGKHALGGPNMQELVSEGNLSLMQAVEKFDYTRGFRFATYASWVIAKDFARKMPAQTAYLEKQAQGLPADLQKDFRTSTATGVQAIERARQSLIQVIKDNLDSREQHIIINHFGLVGSLVKKQKKTLGEIGDDLGLTKERVRQVELGALQKLRQLLSIEEFELLTG